MIRWMGHRMTLVTVLARILGCSTFFFLLAESIHTTAREPLAGQTALKVRCWPFNRRFARFVMRATRVTILGTETWEQTRFLLRFRCHQPEEGVMLDTRLPQFLGGAMVL
uniref:Putative secreted protein n=1 Tax=Anopheles darlingi TaxID=43151 RepID=A0A2M4D5L6_ANODA